MKYGKEYWINKLGKGWAMALKDILKDSYGKKLMDYLSVQYAMKEVNPRKENLFSNFLNCPWEDTKIVIVTTEPPCWMEASGYGIGEPYDNLFHSNSLTKVFDCIEREYHIPEQQLYWDFDFSLEEWAKQGVLLLNLSLTVEKDSPGSHQKPWAKFISQVLNSINDYKPGTIFILWGEKPQKLIPYISDKNYVLKYTSPAEVAFDQQWNCPNFKEADKILTNLYGETINW
jgi:uracil-DNA glycosylase